MQTFTCPNCGHRSTYDPWVESAHCDRCDYRTSRGRRVIVGYHHHARRESTPYQAYLDELVAHWNGTHTPNPGFTLPTAEQALAFFDEYRRSLGESPGILAGPAEFLRNYEPTRGEILTVVGAYLLLRQGKRAQAAQHLGALTMSVPQFTDPWVWLSGTTDDPAQRKAHLEQAIVHNPAHPLANDGMALLQGRFSHTKGAQTAGPAGGTHQSALNMAGNCTTNRERRR